jgi:hypothetical protein
MTSGTVQTPVARRSAEVCCLVSTGAQLARPRFHHSLEIKAAAYLPSRQVEESLQPFICNIV